VTTHFPPPGRGFIIAVFKLYDPVFFANLRSSTHSFFQQALGASSEIFRYMDEEEEIKEKPARWCCRSSVTACGLKTVSFPMTVRTVRKASILRNINPGNRPERSSHCRLQRSGEEHASPKLIPDF